MQDGATQRFEVEIIDQNVGEEAGYKSIVFKIGENSYGWLKYENGVHRLVKFLHSIHSQEGTLVLLLFCYPAIDNKIEIEINEKDIKVDTFRASGAGGHQLIKLIAQ